MSPATPGADRVRRRGVKEGRATLTIADDGRGLRPETTRVGKGLTNMRRRAEQAGGTFAVSNRASGGTELRCSVPRRVPS
jgi:two-component system, NarL family, sensor histidine kinase DevS